MVLIINGIKKINGEVKQITMIFGTNVRVCS